MFSKKKNEAKIDAEQRELYDNARRRMLQKKRLFHHFVIFLIGAVFLIVLNVVIGYQENFKILGYDWFVAAILIWAFLFLIHFFNVFVTSSLMGKEWEAKQMERLVNKQKKKIAELDKKVEKDYPVKKSEQTRDTDKTTNLNPGPESPSSSENPDKPLNT